MYVKLSQFSKASCDSDMIQYAVDLAETTGQAVLIPKINPRTGYPRYDITKTIILPNDCDLALHNCHLRLADDAVCNMFRNRNGLLPIVPENEQQNITIRGIGRPILDGGVHNGIYEHNGIARKIMKPSEHKPIENCMMRFHNVRHLTIEGVTVRNQRYWAILLTYVSYSRFSNLHFESASNVPNQDGLDICKGCHDIIAENITGCTGDNLIAICALGLPPAPGTGDVYNISVHNVLGYGVGGCGLIRILNHDGNKIYNISIDTVIEVSPWSVTDAPLAPNPDLLAKTDDEGNLIPWDPVKPGAYGYRIETPIQIGEAYWYSHSKAQHGDTFGITVRNVMTHARFAIQISNTLMDSTFENIRIFGNGYMAAYFGEGHVENIHFHNVTFDRTSHPIAEDEHIHVEWNNTKVVGYHCFAFHNTNVINMTVDGLTCATENNPMKSVFGGTGHGSVSVSRLQQGPVPLLSDAEGIDILL